MFLSNGCGLAAITEIVIWIVKYKKQKKGDNKDVKNQKE